MNNLALTLYTDIEIYSTELLRNSLTRPVGATNAWTASLDDTAPELSLVWDAPQTISEISLFFDTDYDQAMETVQMGHYDNVMPYCVRQYTISDDKGNIISSCSDNHLALNTIKLARPVTTAALNISVKHPGEQVPASIFHIVIK